MREQTAIQLSDSELSLQLPNASTPPSGSDHSDSGGFGESNDESKVDARASSPPALPSRKGKSTTKAKTTKQRSSSNSKKSFAKNTAPATTSTTARKKAKDKASIKDQGLYCICRKGYDGKEFMIACDGCQEWFHGRCVGVKPKTVAEHYFCKACTEQKETQAAAETAVPQQKNTANKGKSKKSTGKQTNQTRNKSKKQSPEPLVPETVVVAEISLDGEEDLDDICPICEFECTCGAAATVGVDKKSELGLSLKEEAVSTSNCLTDVWEVTDLSKQDENTAEVIERFGHDADREPKTKNKRKTKKSAEVKGKHKLNRNNKLELHDVDIDGEQSILPDNSEHPDSVTDEPCLDDEIDMHGSATDRGSESYCSSIHIDSGDDQDIELEEERAIIKEMQGFEDELNEFSDASDANSLAYTMDDSDDMREFTDISEDDNDEEDADEDDEEVIQEYYAHAQWSSSEENDDSEEEEMSGDEAAEGNGALFAGIASAFLQILAPLAEPTETNTIPSSNASLANLPMDMASFDLTGFPGDSELLRRPSLPSSKVAAHNRATGRIMSDLNEHALLAPGLPIPWSSATKEDESASTTDTSDDLARVYSSLTAILSSAAVSPDEPNDLLSMGNLQPTGNKLQDQLLGMLRMGEFTNNDGLSEHVSALQNNTIQDLLSSNQLFSPTQESAENDAYAFPSSDHSLDALTPTASLSTDSLKRRDTSDSMFSGKKQRTSAKLNSISELHSGDPSTMTDHWDISPSSPPQLENESAPVSMDELVDTSQLYTRSSSRSPSPEPEEQDTQISRDLSRWQRVPIGAFRLLRSKK